MVRYHESKKKKKKSRKHVTIIHIHHSGIIGCQTQNKRTHTHTHTNKYNDIFHTCRGIIDAVLCSRCLPDIRACIGGFNTKLKKKKLLVVM